MARVIEPLQEQYGKLTVLQERNNVVSVRCTCGAVKEVLRSNLRNGRVKSCGRSECREYTIDPNNNGRRGPKINGPTWLKPEKIFTVWRAYHEGVKGRALGTEYGVPSATVYSLIQRIRAHGGIIPYLGAINAERERLGYRLLPVPDRDPATPNMTPIAPPPPKPMVVTAREPDVSPLGVPKPPAVFVRPPRITP